MITLKPREPPPFVSSHPLALVSLTVALKNGQSEPVEWTSVRKIRWTSNNRSYIRHVLEPILKEHIGAPGYLARSMKITGLGLGLKTYDIGCRLVIDVPLDPLSDESEYDLHVEG